MRILFKNANLIGKKGESVKKIHVFTDGEFITFVGRDIDSVPEVPDRVIDCDNLLLIPGLYNMHTHLPMSAFKGYAEDMRLQDWLMNAIFPAEERLDEEVVYYFSLLSIAEQIKNGIISCSDMYFFTEAILMAVDESFTKINASRAVQSFEPGENPAGNLRFKEAKAIHKNYHNSGAGRIKIDMAIHAEYTSNEPIVRAVADFSNENRTINHVHISETRREHEECIARHGVTPTEYFMNCGLFESPSVAAHCVHVTDEDIAYMDERGVTVVHNPSSNLKLASGIAPVAKMLERGINVTLGTDGSASNNNLDIMKEMYLASILQKNATGDPTVLPASVMLKLATENAAKAQGRYDSGFIAAGMRADIAALDLSSVEAHPIYDFNNALVYSLGGRNVALTMCDGRIIYEKGEYKTIDIEKVKYTTNRLLTRLR